MNELENRTGRMENRVALVTGSGANIGEAIARRLAAEGASLVIADINADLGEAVAASLRESGSQAIAVIADLTTLEGINSAFEEGEAEFGHIDALVNNAYSRVHPNNFEPFLSISPSNWQSFFQANTTMFFGASQRMARALAHAGRPGSIVNISSHGAARAHREHLPYDAVKGAMESFTRAAAVDLAPWRIRVNAIRPGSIRVKNEPVDWSGDNLQNSQIPLGTQGLPSDVAESVLHFLSTESAYVTGQIFNVDGGLAAQARAPQVEPHFPAGPETLRDFPIEL